MTQEDKKVVNIAISMFQEFCENTHAEHTHRGYTLRVFSHRNTVTFGVTKGGRVINYLQDTCYPNSNVYTQRDTLFELSIPDTLYKYLYVMYHTKAQSKDLVVDII